MNELQKLIGRLRADELTLDEFADAAAEQFVARKPREYPETDGNEGVLTGVSGVTLATAVRAGELTVDEKQAIIDRL